MKTIINTQIHCIQIDYFRGAMFIQDGHIYSFIGVDTMSAKYIYQTKI